MLWNGKSSDENARNLPIFFALPCLLKPVFFTARLQVAGLRFEVGELTNTKISRISGVSNISSHL